MLVLAVAGARPNFMKVAAVMAAFERVGIPHLLVHTGQHYDENMSRLFFEELKIPAPDLNLEVGRGSHAQQTAEVMRRFEPVVVEKRPDIVLVVGDVNSTMACALVAAKLGVPVAHVEAGLRSFDRTMPEEINRIVTDAVSDFLFVSERSGLENLKREGIPDHKVHFVGNVMIDTLLRHRAEAEKSQILSRLGLGNGTRYALVTLHRPSNVDAPERLHAILRALGSLSELVTVVFPMHPRTRRGVEHAGLEDELRCLVTTGPLGYLDFLNLMAHASLVVTDSGGVQEETTVLGVPCLTVRQTTERPATVEWGTNRLVGLKPSAMLEAAEEIVKNGAPPHRVPELWDGEAAKRIAAIFTRVARGATKSAARRHTGRLPTAHTNRG